MQSDLIVSKVVAAVFNRGPIKWCNTIHFLQSSFCSNGYGFMNSSIVEL